MKRLHRFVLMSFVGPFFMTFFICAFVLLMQFLWKYIDDLVGKGLEWHIVVELLTYASLSVLFMAFPLSILLASIMTFGNLGENYELTAMKSSGISLFRIMQPLVIFAIAMTVFAFYFQNNILPVTNMKLYALMYSVRQQKPEMVVNEGIFTNEIDGYSIKVDEKSNDSNMLYGVLIYDHTGNQGNVSVTVADSGFMKMSTDKKFMLMTLFNGATAIETNPNERGKDRRYPFRRNIFGKQIIAIPLKGFDFKRIDENLFRNAYKMMNLRQLEHTEDSLYRNYGDRVRQFTLTTRYNDILNRSISELGNPVDSLRNYHKPVADDTLNFAAVIDNMDEFVHKEVLASALSLAKQNKQVINQNTNELDGLKKALNKYSMEKHKKFTWSIACLIFFFIGAPLGAIIRKGGLGMPVVVSILLFIVYHIVTTVGEKFAREDIWSMFSGMWFATFVFLPLGLFLTYKAANDSAILSMEAYQMKLKKLMDLILFWKNKKENNTDENSAVNL